MQFVALSYQRFHSKSWQPLTDFRFLAADTLLPITIHESRALSLIFPIAFIQRDGRYQPVIMMGLQGQNIFISEDGRWLTNQLPLIYQMYPFKLGRNSQQQEVLCVDADSDCIVDNADGQAFFDKEQQVSEAVRQKADIVQAAANYQQQTETACQLMAEFGLFDSWPIRLQRPADSSKEASQQTLTGLSRISLNNFNKLPANQLAALRDNHALQLIYAHLTAKSHMSKLGKISARRQAAQSQRQDFDLQSYFDGDDDSLSFDD